jgi:hypothetical protein
MIERARSSRVGNRRAHPPAADHPLQSHFLHQPGDRAAGDIEALPPQLPPDFAHAVDLEVLVEHAPDLPHQLDVTLDAPRCRLRLRAAAGMRVVS